MCHYDDGLASLSLEQLQEMSDPDALEILEEKVLCMPVDSRPTLDTPKCTLIALVREHQALRDQLELSLD